MKKGYTLVELLAVIVILSFLFLIAYTGVKQYLDYSNDNAFETYEKNLQDIGQEYFNKEINSTVFSRECLSIKKMVDQKYIKDYIDVNDNDIPDYYFLKSYNNKSGNVCDGYVIIETVSNDLVITPYLKCGYYSAENNSVIQEKMTDNYSDSERSTCDD